MKAKLLIGMIIMILILSSYIIYDYEKEARENIYQEGINYGIAYKNRDYVLSFQRIAINNETFEVEVYDNNNISYMVKFGVIEVRSR